MTAKTHILGGILAGELVCIASRVPIQAAPVLLAGAAAGALLPDIDHRGSKISRSSVAGKVTSFAVSAVTTHRGVIHTPACILAVVAALYMASAFASWSLWPALILGIAVGMLSHLALDTLNPGGIMWLWPLTKKRFHLASIRTNSILELVVTAVLLALVVWLAAVSLPELAGEIRRLLPKFLRGIGR